MEYVIPHVWESHEDRLVTAGEPATRPKLKEKSDPSASIEQAGRLEARAPKGRVAVYWQADQASQSLENRSNHRGSLFRHYSSQSLPDD